MKILTFLNISNPMNINADSAFIFYSLLSDYLVDEGKHELIVVSPKELPSKLVKNINLEEDFNKYSSRFSFNWGKVSEIIEEIKPDILLINQTEQVPHYRAVLESLGLKTPIFLYVHYIPYFFEEGRLEIDPSLNNNGLGKAVLLHFLSGLLLSDCIFTHSETSKKLLIDLIESFHESLNCEIIINPPPFDPYLYDFRNNPEMKAFYNHRLYKHYGTDFFIELVKKINEKFNIKINVLDVLGKRTDIQERMDPSVSEARNILADFNGVQIFNNTFIRANYKNAMKDSLFSIAPYRKNCIWAMSCIDSTLIT